MSAGAGIVMTGAARDAFHAQPSRVVVLVPAHNEEALISGTVSSLFAQTRRPDHVIVVADNCTDRTPELAAEAGAEVFYTRDNRHKKAGGLNQALGELLPDLGGGDFVLVMDGDSRLAPTFIEAALGAMEPEVGAVGGIFLAARTSNLVERLQHNEYIRYSREIARGKKQAKVITGTGSLFRAAALKEIVEARRSGSIPGGRTQVYDTLALTEDNELTLALKTLGWRCISPKDCLVVTDVMPSWGKLWSQRLRWQRGAFENLKAYGFTRVTAPYIFKQAFMGLGTFAISLLILLTLLSALTGMLSFRPLWAALGSVFLAERIVTVRRGGRVSMALASVLVIEFAYDVLQQAVYVKCLADMILGRTARWGGNHVFVEGELEREDPSAGVPVHTGVERGKEGNRNVWKDRKWERRWWRRRDDYVAGHRRFPAARYRTPCGNHLRRGFHPDRRRPRAVEPGPSQGELDRNRPRMGRGRDSISRTRHNKGWRSAQAAPGDGSGTGLKPVARTAREHSPRAAAGGGEGLEADGDSPGLHRVLSHRLSADGLARNTPRAHLSESLEQGFRGDPGTSSASAENESSTPADAKRHARA